MAEKKKDKTNNKSNGGSKKLRQEARVPPHNLEMERALLCSALIDPDGYARVVDVVDEDSFYDRRHGLIFAAMNRLFSKSAPVDVLTVSEELEHSDDLESAGGPSYLTSLSLEVATSTHAEHYAKVVREKAALRALITMTSQVSNEAYDSGDVEELIDQSMQRLFEIAIGRKDTGAQPIRPVLTNLHEHLDKLHNREDDTLTGIGSGFRELDNMTSGFQNGDLIVIAARPSMGKTAFSLDMARHASQKERVPVAFFSLEMANVAIAMRLIASDARLDLHKLRTGRLSGREWQRLSLSTGELSEMPFFIDDTGTLSVTDLRARARMLKQQHNIGIVFVDYLQLMKPPQAGSREQEVAKISQALKGLARELEVPVVALSQLSRAVEHRGDDARPQLSDLRDSGAIEQDADLVIFIHRNIEYSNLSESEKEKKLESGEKEEEVERKANCGDIIIRKQRNGPTGTIELTFLKKFACFEDKASEADRKLAVSQPSIPVEMPEEEDAPF